MDWLTDAEREEEIRCAALGMEGPNAKSYRGESWADMADTIRKQRKEAEGTTAPPKPKPPTDVDPQDER